MSKSLTEFGRLVRKARIDAEVTMKDMADYLKYSSSYVSGTENGHRHISAIYIDKVCAFFAGHGCEIDRRKLRIAADVSNGYVSVDGLPQDHQLLVARLARAKLSDRDTADLTRMLKELLTEKTK